RGRLRSVLRGHAALPSFTAPAIGSVRIICGRGGHSPKPEVIRSPNRSAKQSRPRASMRPSSGSPSARACAATAWAAVRISSSTAIVSPHHWTSLALASVGTASTGAFSVSTVMIFAPKMNPAECRARCPRPRLERGGLPAGEGGSDFSRGETGGELDAGRLGGGNGLRLLRYLRSFPGVDARQADTGAAQHADAVASHVVRAPYLFERRLLRDGNFLDGGFGDRSRLRPRVVFRVSVHGRQVTVGNVAGRVMMLAVAVANEPLAIAAIVGVASVRRGVIGDEHFVGVARLVSPLGDLGEPEAATPSAVDAEL